MHVSLMRKHDSSHVAVASSARTLWILVQCTYLSIPSIHPSSSKWRQVEASLNRKLEVAQATADALVNDLTRELESAQVRMTVVSCRALLFLLYSTVSLFLLFFLCLRAHLASLFLYRQPTRTPPWPWKSLKRLPQRQWQLQKKHYRRKCKR